MTTGEITAAPFERQRRFYPEWVPAVLVWPRRTFQTIAAHSEGVWLAALVLLTLTGIARVGVQGYLDRRASMGGEVILPPGFEYYSPEQQAQFYQALEAKSSPVFSIVLPALSVILGVWLGWLIVSGLLHLALTLLGGRGSSPVATNIVAWAAIPLALRDVVRAAYMAISGHTIVSTGLAGFVATDAGGALLFLGALAGLTDLYLIWHIILLIVGVRTADTNLSRGKALLACLGVMVIVIGFQALAGFAAAQVSNLSIMRPFFF